MTKRQFYTSVPTLETLRLELRPMRTTDAEDVYEYASDPEVPLYLRWDPHPNLLATKEYVRDVVSGYEKGTDGPWVIQNRDNGSVIGAIHIYQFNQTQKLVEIGYVLGKEYWNRGIMTEALTRVIEFCFRDLDINRVQAICKPRNRGSARVLQKAGLQLEGRLRQYLFEKGQYWDVDMYAVLKHDWEKG